MKEYVIIMDHSTKLYKVGNNANPLFSMFILKSSDKASMFIKLAELANKHDAFISHVYDRRGRYIGDMYHYANNVFSKNSRLVGKTLRQEWNRCELYRAWSNWVDKAWYSYYTSGVRTKMYENFFE